jgi:uncharacterized membrane protein YjfL (UPF0719 family)
LEISVNLCRDDALIQFAAGMLLLVVVILLTTQIRPYEDLIIYYLVILFNLALILTLLSGVMFYSSSTINKQSLASFVIFMNLAIMSIMLVFIVLPFLAKIDLFKKLNKFKVFNSTAKSARSSEIELIAEREY